MYLFSRPTSREERGPAARSGRRRIRCFATSTIRERVENACYNFILLQVAFSRLRASSRGHANRVYFRQLLPSCSLSPSAVASIRRIDRRNGYFVNIYFRIELRLCDVEEAYEVCFVSRGAMCAADRDGRATKHVPCVTRASKPVF